MYFRNSQGKCPLGVEGEELEKQEQEKRQKGRFEQTQVGEIAEKQKLWDQGGDGFDKRLEFHDETGGRNFEQRQASSDIDFEKCQSGILYQMQY